MKRKLFAFLLAVCATLVNAQYCIKPPAWETVYQEVKNSKDFKDALTKANLKESDLLPFTNFGTLKHHCDKLKLTCEGDRYDARVIITTKKNSDGVSYKGEYTISYYRSDKFCNLLNKFESAGGVFNQWVPVGKKSKISSSNEALDALKLAFGKKEAFEPFQKKMSYHVSDVIKIDNIEYQPKFDQCDINNKQFYRENKTLPENEVLVFTADLTWADFLFDEIENPSASSKKENNNEDDDDAWNQKDLVSYKYKSIEKVYKRKYLINLWLNNDGSTFQIKYIELNCQNELVVDDSLKNNLHASLTNDGVDPVWNKTTKVN
jgi:hypothetical protein